MTTTTAPTTHRTDARHLPQRDRLLILIDTHASLARRSATVGTWGERVARRERQARFNRAWGLR